jgi:glyoxylase-like metal-dependent hydrolase (beta-lactamase superfamily II)
MKKGPLLQLVSDRTAGGAGTATGCAPHEALRGLGVVQRGWLSSNNVLIHGTRSGEGATLVDTSHCLHAEQTVALLHAALGAEPLNCVLNTHLHSDHCGGNAAVHHAFSAPVFVPSGGWQAVQHWDDQQLGYSDVGQRMVPFKAQGSLVDGEQLQLGGRCWQVIAAPGHDPDAVMLFDTDHGVLISGDALWQDGFGVVFPELDGKAAFDDVAQVLDQIERLPVQWVIPGHGAPFIDVGPALARARSRLAAFRATPLRHARYAAKVLIKYHLMEERAMAWPALRSWACARPMFARAFHDQGALGGASMADWFETLVHELAARGAVAIREGVVHDI